MAFYEGLNPKQLKILSCYLTKLTDKTFHRLMLHHVCYYFLKSLNTEGIAVAWWLMPRTPDPEVGVRAPLRSNRVVSLSKAHLLPKSTGNTQEAVAPSQHD